MSEQDSQDNKLDVQIEDRHGDQAKLKILAQAVYDLRLILAGHLSQFNDSMDSENVAAHLAYALHNEALAIIENRPEDFNVSEALKRIERLDDLMDTGFYDVYLQHTKPSF